MRLLGEGAAKFGVGQCRTGGNRMSPWPWRIWGSASRLLTSRFISGIKVRLKYYSSEEIKVELVTSGDLSSEKYSKVFVADSSRIS